MSPAVSIQSPGATLLAAGAISPKGVVLSFDRPVEPPHPGALVFEPQTAPAAPVNAVSVRAYDSPVTVQLNTELSPEATYRVTVAGTSGSATFQGARPPTPPGRQFDLWSMLPKYNRRSDATGDLRRFIACLQEVTDLLLSDIDRFTDIFDLERAPERFLDLILADLGNPFPFHLDTLGKRKLASCLVGMYRQKGTAVGIVNAIRFFLGIEVTVDAHHVTSLVLGDSELGVDWVLGPSDRRALYTFDLVVGRILTPTERDQVAHIANWMKPAQTHLGQVREPQIPMVAGHWVLDVSRLSETTILQAQETSS